MKKLPYFVLAFVSMICVCSCGNQSASDLSAKVDSLQTALAQRDSDYRQLDEFISVVASSLDSIAKQEAEIFDPSKESPVANQKMIKEQLAHFKETLAQQRQRIAQLEEQLKNGQGTAKKLQRIIVSLKAQLTEKESQIAALQDELNNKNITISDLTERLSVMHQQNTSQQNIIASQNKMLEDQDDMLNEGYVIIASKSELKKNGLLTSGFMKKNKVDINALDKKLFKAIDIRVVTEIDINSKKPEVLTQMPEDSYTIEKNGKNSILRIVNPERFWSVSKYLIIQTD